MFKQNVGTLKIYTSGVANFFFFFIQNISRDDNMELWFYINYK